MPAADRAPLIHPRGLCSPLELAQVKYDPWNAAKWFMEAEQMQREQEASKQTNVFEDIDIEDPQLRASLLVRAAATDIVWSQLQPQSCHQAVHLT